MKKLKIALDWTPNINHIGLFIALEKGFYSNLGLDVAILNPDTDGYKMTPGKKLDLDLADFAITPFETVISLNNKANKIDAIAVYAILQEDISSIVTLQSSGIDRPNLLAGKTYASYKARYEDLIVQEMIKNDGGITAANLIYPEKLGIWNTLQEGKADATWIFNNWEGVEAKNKNIELHSFTMRDYKIPYCYSPIMITKQQSIIDKRAYYQNFVKATRAGYLFCHENADEALSILAKYVSRQDQYNINLQDALVATVPYIGSSETAGIMNEDRVRVFLDWLVAHKLEDAIITSQKLFTNELLT